MYIKLKFKIPFKNKLKKIKVNRNYKLKLFGSKSKFEDLRWSAKEFTEMTNMFNEHLYFNNHVKFYSTKGFGNLGNQAQRKAMGMVRIRQILEEEFKQKKKIPHLHKQLCFANIKKQSTHKHFNYKINFAVSFGGERSKSRFVFAKGTRPLKVALKQGWKLSNQCEIAYDKKDECWYVYIFVSKEIHKAHPKTNSIGIDVGINSITSTSEGRLGNSLTKKLKKLNESKSEKRRQFDLAKNRKDSVLVEKLSKELTKNKNISKTIIKQLLDKEAKKIIARGLSTSSNLVVEDPKALANMKFKILNRWAKTYFAYRLQTLGKEKGVFVVFVNPAYTSVTCPKCGCKDKKNRVKLKFRCHLCGHADHSDVNGAINLARKGQDFVDIYLLKTKPKISAVKTT